MSNIADYQTAMETDSVTNKPMPKVSAKIVASDVAVPVDVQFSALKADKANITWHFAIRATGNNWVATNIDFSSYGKVMLRVDNTHDQPVTLTFLLQDIGDYSDLAGNIVKVVIPANKSQVLVTSKDLFLLEQPMKDAIAINGTCTTAPTTGDLTIIAHFFPIV